MYNRYISSIRSLFNYISKSLRLAGSVDWLRIKDLKTDFFICDSWVYSLLFVNGSTRNGNIFGSSLFTKLGFTYNRVIVESSGCRVLNIQSHILSLVNRLNDILSKDSV